MMPLGLSASLWMLNKVSFRKPKLESWRIQIPFFVEVNTFHRVHSCDYIIITVKIVAAKLLHIGEEIVWVGVGCIQDGSQHLVWACSIKPTSSIPFASQTRKEKKHLICRPRLFLSGDCNTWRLYSFNCYFMISGWKSEPRLTHGHEKTKQNVATDKKWQDFPLMCQICYFLRFFGTQ